MRISLLQYPIAWADKAQNLLFFQEKIAALSAQTDVVILPEMFTTGFCTAQPELAEPMQGETVNTLCKWAKDYDVAIVGSFIAKENGKMYNRAFFVTPEGSIAHSDKRHLFSLAKEHELFGGGNTKLLVNYKGVNFLVLVCYDLRFPVWSRNVNNEYDVLVYVANFPTKRIADWDTLLAARAIENQAYVCGVNRVGTDGLGIDYNGHSALLDYKGEKLLQFDDYEENAKTSIIDLAKLRIYREKFPAWRDADCFLMRYAGCEELRIKN